MPDTDLLDIRHTTEPFADGVRFILPRSRGRARGGFCAILFGLMFSGFAMVWILGVSGMFDSVIDSIFETTIEPELQQKMRDFEEKAKKAMETARTKATTPTPAGPETAGPETAPPQTPATETPLEHLQRQNPPPSGGGFDFGRIFMMLFGIPFLLAGLMPITFGILMMVGHSEVEITPDFVTSIQRAGPLRRRQRRGSMNLTRLEIGRGPEHRAKLAEQTDEAKPKPIYALNAIHAEFKDESVLVIAPGYPLTTLRALAKDIENEHQRITSILNVIIDEPQVPEAGRAAASEPYSPEPVPPQPVASTAILDRVSSGITIRIPPVGFTKAAMVPFLFGLFWCGFVAIFTFIMFAIGVPAIMYAFISIFWIVGALVLLLGLSMMRRQAVVDVVHDTLLVTHKGLFGRSQHEWRVDELLDVRVDHSGTTINSQPVLNLQFVPREGTIIALGTGRPDEELHWMAAEIRTALQMNKREA